MKTRWQSLPGGCVGARERLFNECLHFIGAVGFNELSDTGIVFVVLAGGNNDDGKISLIAFQSQ